jgi:hypothetical protein
MLYALYRLGDRSRQTTHSLPRGASTILNESSKFEPDWIKATIMQTTTKSAAHKMQLSIRCIGRQCRNGRASFDDQVTNKIT